MIIKIQTIIPILFAVMIGIMPVSLTANNSLAWNPTPVSVSSGGNDITLNYSINQSGIIAVQLFDENWNPIGQQAQNVSTGSGQITLTLTPDSTPSTTNFLQAKLLNNNWSPLIETLQVTVAYSSGGSGANSLVWNPEPTSISTGTNNITLDYSINQNGVIFVQVFDKDWNKLDQDYQNVSTGTSQATLSLSADSPSADVNYLQAFLFDSGWGDIGVPRLDLTLPGEVSPPPATNSLTWNPQPTSLSAGTNNFTLDYSINQNAVIFIQVFDENWDRFDYDFENVSAGSGQLTLPLSVSSPSANNYLQAFLYDANWGEIGVPRLDLTLSSASGCATAQGVCKVYPDTENELLGTDGIYEANMYVSDTWAGSLTAFWGQPEGVFWVEWDNNGSDSGHQAHEEFDYKALRASWTNAAVPNGYPSKINQITDPNLSCTANGQWQAGSSGRCHINMTAWIYDYDGDGSRCDVIIHTWDNSGNFRAKFTGGRFTNLGTISDNGVTYDVLRTLPGGLGEKASYNLIPQNGRQNTPLAAFPSNTQFFNVNVKKILDQLIILESSQGQTINSSWYLDGMEWTVTGQSGDNVGTTFVPDSQGKWTFNSYNIPNISNSNKLVTDTQEMNFDVFPNPFSHSFNIEYDLIQTEPVSIQLFTQEGKGIKVIKNKENETAGNHIETINTSDLPSGIYLIHLTTSSSHGVKKLIKF